MARRVAGWQDGGRRAAVAVGCSGGCGLREGTPELPAVRERVWSRRAAPLPGDRVVVEDTPRCREESLPAAILVEAEEGPGVRAARVEVTKGTGGLAGGLAGGLWGAREQPRLRSVGQQCTTNDGHGHEEDQVQRQGLVIGDDGGGHLDGHPDEADRLRAYALERSDEAQHDVGEALREEACSLRRVQRGPRIQTDQRERHVVAVVRIAGRDVAVGRRRVHEDLCRGWGDGIFSEGGSRDAQLVLSRREISFSRIAEEADISLSMDELVALGLQRRGVKGVSWRRWQYRGAAALDALGLGVCDASSGAA
eukprot:scaffold68863_cov61-Phaeocystis_antarctica.AAC.6